MSLFNKIKNKIINALSIIGDKEEQNKSKDEVSNNPLSKSNITSSDFIDYDGMGNQGRFPSRDNKNI